jgi:hypothetical protein
LDEILEIDFLKIVFSRMYIVDPLPIVVLSPFPSGTSEGNCGRPCFIRNFALASPPARTRSIQVFPVLIDTESVSTYSVFMNVTISVDDELLNQAREVARLRGMSFQQLIRAYLESITDQRSGDEIAGELFALMDETPGRSGGVRFSREDAYEGRL